MSDAGDNVIPKEDIEDHTDPDAPNKDGGPSPALGPDWQPVDTVDQSRDVENFVDPDAAKKQDTETGAGPVWNRDKEEDRARRWIAYALIGIFAAVIAAMFALLAFGMITVEELKEFSVVTGPLVTLVSAATGFYYGTKSK